MLAKRRTPHGSGLGKYRYVVERSLAWFHDFRKLEIREERNSTTYEALTLLAQCLICKGQIKR